MGAEAPQAGVGDRKFDNLDMQPCPELKWTVSTSFPHSVEWPLWVAEGPATYVSLTPNKKREYVVAKSPKFNRYSVYDESDMWAPQSYAKTLNQAKDTAKALYEAYWRSYHKVESVANNLVTGLLQ